MFGLWVVHPIKGRTAYVIPAEHASRPVGCHTEPAIDLATYAQEICSVSCPDRHRSAKEMRAYARLIATAPELLDALQPFVAHNSDAETITIIVRAADVKRARAAIAKATGEQQ